MTIQSYGSPPEPQDDKHSCPGCRGVIFSEMLRCGEESEPEHPTPIRSVCRRCPPPFGASCVATT